MVVYLWQCRSATLVRGYPAAHTHRPVSCGLDLLPAIVVRRPGQEDQQGKQRSKANTGTSSLLVIYPKQAVHRPVIMPMMHMYQRVV